MSHIKKTQDGKSFDLDKDGWNYFGRIERTIVIKERYGLAVPTDEYAFVDTNRELPTYSCLYLIVIGDLICFLGRDKNGIRGRFSSGIKHITKSEMTSLWGTSARMNNIINRCSDNNLAVELYLMDVSSLELDQQVKDLQQAFFDKYNPAGMVRQPEAH